MFILLRVQSLGLDLELRAAYSLGTGAGGNSTGSSENQPGMFLISLLILSPLLL